jgi:tetratricopeptide (TPR) repeat protein
MVWQYNTNLYFENLFLPLLKGKSLDPSYALLSRPHILDIFNEIILISPLLPLLLYLPFAGPRKRVVSGSQIFLGLMVLALGIFLLIIDPKLTMPRDWDLFAILGLPLTGILLLSAASSGLSALKMLFLPVIFLLVGSTGGFLSVNFNHTTSIQYAQYICRLDPLKSMGTTMILRNQYESRGEKAQADSLNLVILKTYPNFIRMQDALWIINRGQKEEASRAVAGIDPGKFSENYHRLMCSYYLLAGDCTGAKNEASMLAQLNWYSDQTFFLLAKSEECLGNHTDALKNLRKAYHLNNQRQDILIMMTNIYLMMNNSDSAVIYGQKAVSADSSSYEALYLTTKAYLQKRAIADALKYARLYRQYGARDPRFTGRSKEVDSLLSLYDTSGH